MHHDRGHRDRDSAVDGIEFAIADAINNGIGAEEVWIWVVLRFGAIPDNVPFSGAWRTVKLTLSPSGSDASSSRATELSSATETAKLVAVGGSVDETDREKDGGWQGLQVPIRHGIGEAIDPTEMGGWSVGDVGACHSRCDWWAAWESCT